MAQSNHPLAFVQMNPLQAGYSESRFYGDKSPTTSQISTELEYPQVIISLSIVRLI